MYDIQCTYCVTVSISFQIFICLIQYSKRCQNSWAEQPSHRNLVIGCIVHCLPVKQSNVHCSVKLPLSSSGLVRLVQCLAPVTADNTIRSEPEPASAELVQTDTAVPEHSGKIADSLAVIFFICITATPIHSSDQKTRTSASDLWCLFILRYPTIVQRQLTEGSELQGCRFDEGLVVRNEAGSQQLVPGRGCQ